ncbi:MAG: hypothetical protein HUJ68_04595 [Clostridia bacterium]|nr:hypothetical protein [Clostridia bacterium]
MGNEKVKKPPNYDILKKGSKEDLITIISILQEENEKLKKEKSEKEKRKSDCAIIKRISSNTKFSERELCVCFSINRKTYYNYKKIPNHANGYRKDFKHNNLVIRAKVENIYYEQQETAGAYKIAEIMNKNGNKISVPTVRRILRESNLYPCWLPVYYT